MDRKLSGGVMARPTMVNGVWPAERREEAEAAAEELRRVGLGKEQVKFSASPESCTEVGTATESSVLDRLRSLFGGSRPESEEPREQVVLRTWPPEEMVVKVEEVMRRFGAQQVRRWEGAAIANRHESVADRLRVQGQ